VATGKEKTSLPVQPQAVTSVAFSPDCATLASGSYGKDIQLWDVASGKERASLKGHMLYVHSIVFSPDGKTLASGSADATIRLWNLNPEK
jgi:WD40 repeat protein